MAVAAPAVRPEAAETAHEPRPAVIAAVDPELLSLVAVAAPLQVGAERQPPRRIDLGDQVDHAAGGVPVQDRARAADDLDAPHRPEVDAARLGGPVGGGQRNPVLDDGQSADAEHGLGRRGADAQRDAARQPVVAPVLDGQARHAAQRLVERRLPLGEAERLGPQHRHRVGHVVQALLRPRHGDRLGQRRDGQGEVDNRLHSRDPRCGGVGAEPGQEDGYLVVSRGQPHDLVVAVLAGHRAARQAGRGMPRGDGHAGQQAAQLVADDSPDRPGVFLRDRRLDTGKEAQHTHAGNPEAVVTGDANHSRRGSCTALGTGTSRAVTNSTPKTEKERHQHHERGVEIPVPPSAAASRTASAQAGRLEIRRSGRIRHTETRLMGGRRSGWIRADRRGDNRPGGLRRVP